MSHANGLPDEWRLTTLERVTDQRAPIRYGVVQIGPDTLGGVPIVPIKFINRIASASLHRAAHQIEKKYAGSRIQSGDVLISVKGTIGNVGVVPNGFSGNIAREIARVRPNENIDRGYLAFQLQGPSTQRRIKTFTVGSTRLEFSIAALRAFQIPLPPLSEQKKIAEILSTWDMAIETSEKLVANAEAQKRALMQQLLTGRRRLKGFGSGEWVRVQVGSLLKEVRRPVDWSDEDLYSLLSLRRRSGGLFLRERLHGREILTKGMKTTKAGDFLISKMQVVHGAMAMTPARYDGMHISNSYISLITRNKGELEMRFFDWLSRMPFMYRLAYLSSYGVHIEKMTFNLDWFLQEKIGVPTTAAEQSKIADILDAAQFEVDTLSAARAKLLDEKSALMQQLLTGKRRVKL
ncbi:MAG: restriction endonuclease subunit S [Mesorhizobium sp.]|nr:MAG: restriction endonuclease subunit S [Mesorhizobium sp.]TJU97928.1 MAG: restriction endonuclease subunit S [Mesorhizobium sp.]